MATTHHAVAAFVISRPHYRHGVVYAHCSGVWTPERIVATKYTTAEATRIRSLYTDSTIERA